MKIEASSDNGPEVQRLTLDDDVTVDKSLTVKHTQDLLSVEVPGRSAVLVGQVPFAPAQLDEAASWLISSAEVGPGRSVRLANAYCVTLAEQDAEYRQILQESGINFADGTPVSWMIHLRLRDTQVPSGRVRGPSFFQEVLARSNGGNLKHFLLGGTPAALEKLEQKIRAKYPGVTLVGSYSPPFTPLDAETVQAWADKIRNSGANLVWVGLGSPKQDFATTQLSSILGIHCVGVGAAFDFLAGTQAEAPHWMQRSALEWAFRLYKEPKRLWRRYLFGNVQFGIAILRQLRRRTT